MTFNHTSMQRYFGVFFFCVFLSALSSAQAFSFPYRLGRYDWVVMGTSLSTVALARWSPEYRSSLTPDELLVLNPEDIPEFDRGAIRFWDEGLGRSSTWTRNLLIAAPLVILAGEGLKREWDHAMIYGVMYLETALLTKGLTDLTKVLAGRKRPYLYNNSIPFSERVEWLGSSDAEDSFFSGHTAISFASAVFLSRTYTEINGVDRASWFIWGGSLALASYTGYLRYKSGNHFPSDILAGALLGSAVGYLIPQIHRYKTSGSSIVFTLTSAGLRFQWTFSY